MIKIHERMFYGIDVEEQEQEIVEQMMRYVDVFSAELNDYYYDNDVTIYFLDCDGVEYQVLITPQGNDALVELFIYND